MFLIHKFHPLLNKYSILLGYEDAYQDLQLSLLELINRKSIDDFKLQNDGVIVNYIEQSILHEYLAICRQINNQKFVTVCDDATLECNCESTTDEYVELLNSDLKKILREDEIQLLELNILQGISIIDIAAKIGVSRQTVNKRRKNAIKKLQTTFCDNS